MTGSKGNTQALFGLLTLAYLTACPAALAAGNITLFNGDFELPETGPDGVPVGWHRDSHTPVGSVTVDTLRPHEGTRAVRLADFRADHGYALESRLYPAVPGQIYRASASVYNGSGDAWLYLEFYANATTRIAETHLGHGKVGEWAQITVEGKCPPEARYVAVLLYSAIHNIGQSSIDDVTLEGPQGDGEVLNLDSREETPVDYSHLYNVGNAKQLLFDDVFLQSHSRFLWRVCPPRKTGERNLVADKPWESFIINGWFTVMEDEGRYRMWYEVYDKGYQHDLDARYCYAESQDGIHWEKPVLGIQTYQGSTENNILFHTLGGRPVHGGCVFKDPNGPPEERYKFIFLSEPGIWGAVSPDGIHWRLHEGGPILDYPSDTQQVGFWDPRIGKYVAYIRTHVRNRTIGRSESADFFHFPPAETVLQCDDKDPDDMDLYNSAALKYPHAENAYFIFTSAYHHTADNLDVHLAVSRDGVHWARPERRPFIPNGEPGSMDDSTIYCGVGALTVGDEIWMYYHASRAKHNEVYPQNLSYDGVYTRAVLKLDRYVAMDVGVVPGEFVTHPLTFSGNRLEFNADVRPGGFLRVELQDAQGNALPGFSLAECQPVQGDSVRHGVSWAGGSDLSALRGLPVKIRGVARDCSLYAFQFADHK